MTTFTMQDLNVNTTETPEEKEAMDAILNNMAIPQATPDNVIQGATGSQYSAVDLTTFNKPIEEIRAQLQHAPEPQPTPFDRQTKIEHELTHLSIALRNLITAIAEQHQQERPVSDLSEAVGTVLEQAEWFKERVEEAIDEAMEDHDFEYEVDRAVRNELEHFCLEDHVDVDSLVDDAVEDKLDDIVEDKLREILEEKLANMRIVFD